MLHDLDRTIEKLLYDEGKLNKGEIDVSFEQPNSEWSARLSRPTINCWCFDLRENLKLRGTDRYVQRNGNMAETRFPVKRIDLSYLVTSWARKIEDEHQLLWRALAVLKRFPKLIQSDGVGELRHARYEIPMQVADMSNIQANLMDLWSVLDNQMRLGFVVVATVELDTELAFEGPLVLEPIIRIGQSEDPQRRELTGPYGEMRGQGDREWFDEHDEKRLSDKVYEDKRMDEEEE